MADFEPGILIPMEGYNLGEDLVHPKHGWAHKDTLVTDASISETSISPLNWQFLKEQTINQLEQ